MLMLGLLMMMVWLKGGNLADSTLLAYRLRCTRSSFSSFICYLNKIIIGSRSDCFPSGYG